MEQAASASPGEAAEQAAEAALNRAAGTGVPAAFAPSPGAANVPFAASSLADEEQRKLQIKVINNADWYVGVSLLEFLTSVGRYARMGDMLARDSVASRLGLRRDAEGGSAPTGMSFTEFSYQLLQAFDFSVLHDGPHRCSLQLGGSDQMGNIMAGVELILRKQQHQQDDSGEKPLPAYGITTPLLTTSTGAKFGKSAGNAIWLERSKLSDLDFYQYFWRSADADVEKYLRALTLLPIEHIRDVMRKHQEEPRQRLAQTVLAEEVLELVRGADAVRRAKQASEVLFSTDPCALQPDQLAETFLDDPRLVRVERSQIEGIDALALCTLVGLTKSKGEARKIVQGGGFYVNAERVKDASHVVSEQDLLQDRFCVLRLGKNDHRIVFVN